MNALTARERFREAASRGAVPSPWVTYDEQTQTLEDIARRTVAVRASGRRALVGVDLDLTSLLAPHKSVEALASIASSAPGAVAAKLRDISLAARRQLTERLTALWRGELEALVPGYTTTATEGYAVYLAAVLTRDLGLILTTSDQDNLEVDVFTAVHGVLREGYWSRDLLQDEVSPGFAGFVSSVSAAGGEIVFLSNRPRQTRDVSLARLRQVLAQAGLGENELFAFFGPGGSQYDAASKALAVALLEAGAPRGVYLCEVVDGTPKFVSPSPDWQPGSVFVAMIDDRVENRRQVIEAAVTSTAFWNELDATSVKDVAIAAPGFSAELAVMDATARLCFFDRNVA